MTLYTNHITFQSPFSMMVIGHSNNGKTFYINNLVDTLPKKVKIVYIVNSNFDIEPEILERAEKNDKIFIIKAPDLSIKTINFLVKSLTSKDQKLLIFDNFTYQLSLPLLNFFTYSRKYNASSIFICHTLHASKTISPRLKETVNYIVFFYLPNPNPVSYKQFLGVELYNTYISEITHKSYKFLIWDIGESEYSIGKLPEYKLKLVHKDQFNDPTKKKGMKILKQLEQYEQQNKDGLNRT